MILSIVDDSLPLPSSQQVLEFSPRPESARPVTAGSGPAGRAHAGHRKGRDITEGPLSELWPGAGAPAEAGQRFTLTAGPAGQAFAAGLGSGLPHCVSLTWSQSWVWATPSVLLCPQEPPDMLPLQCAPHGAPPAMRAPRPSTGLRAWGVGPAVLRFGPGVTCHSLCPAPTTGPGLTRGQSNG